LIAERVACTDDAEEQVFFIAKFFALQEVTGIHQGIVHEMPVYFSMPSDHTIGDVGANQSL
jgi:hypothetical protein